MGSTRLGGVRIGTDRVPIRDVGERNSRCKKWTIVRPLHVLSLDEVIWSFVEFCCELPREAVCLVSVVRLKTRRNLIRGEPPFVLFDTIFRTIRAPLAVVRSSLIPPTYFRFLHPSSSRAWRALPTLVCPCLGLYHRLIDNSSRSYRFILPSVYEDNFSAQL